MINSLHHPDGAPEEAGFSLPIVLVASLMVLLGGLMLADRAGDGVISAAFQRDSGDAKDAAETGLTRIVGELNRLQNRGLLAKSGSSADPDGYRWTSSDADASRNPCLGASTGTPDLTSNANLGYATSGPYNRVLLNANGQVVSDITQATKAYRLLWVKRQPLSDASGNPLLKIFQPTGRGKVVLAVEGSALRNGQTLSSVRLEEDLQLVPKCCGVPFGGSHGNVAYGPNSDGASVCIAANWGFLGGAAENNTGSIKINGVTTITTGGSNPQPVNPLTCLASSTAGCSFDPTSTPYTLQVSPVDLKNVPEFDEPSPAVVAGRIERVGGALSPDISDNPEAFATCVNSSNAIVPGCSPAATDTVVLNAAVAESSKPNYCRIYTREADGKDGLHCKLAVLNYSAFNVRVINTNVRPLRLYFPNSGSVVQSGGEQNTLILDIPGMAIAKQITYARNANQELRRTGPSIDALGRLQDVLDTNALVARGVTAFDVDTSNPRHPTYRISVRDANGVTYTSGNADGAQCRVRSITG